MKIAYFQWHIQNFRQGVRKFVALDSHPQPSRPYNQKRAMNCQRQAIINLKIVFRIIFEYCSLVD